MQPYLICLEIQPVAVSERYDSLPLHCTLVHWFWLAREPRPFGEIEHLIAGQETPRLILEEEDEFTGMTKAGPVPVRVSRVRHTSQLRALHEMVTTILEEHGVNYMAPYYIHEGYAPHVTHHQSQQLVVGDEYCVTSLYIVSAAAPEYGNERRVVKKMNFTG